MDETRTVTRADVLAAAERISGDVVRTPLIEASIAGRRAWLKAECAQTGGAFKLRGASNRLRQLAPEDAARGVVAFSSGNHAQGVAIAARRLEIAATIVMPADAPKVKIAATENYGARVVLYDRLGEDRVAIAARIAAESGATIVPPFDDPAIIAGQGTVGLELLAQCPEPVRRIVVPCGGGGLAAGIALACPEAAIVGVEPAGWDDMGRSLAGGKIVPVGPNPPPTLCDALQTLRVSELTFAILRERGATLLSVNDAEATAAIRWAWAEHQLRVEPGGAVALAALLAGKVEPQDGMVVILSGGNIEPALFAEITT